MSYTLHIDEDLYSDEMLIGQLKRKNYKLILWFLNSSYGFCFRTDQSGAAFESCIDWCAQNSGSVENAKQVLLRLFDTFYRDLPAPVKENLAYLADEIGYDPRRINISRLKERSKELFAYSTIMLTSLWAQARTYVNDKRLRRRTIPTSMMIRRDDEYILDIPSSLQR